MSQPPDPASSAIEHLYDVAVDPTSYERMLDFWEDMVRHPANGEGAHIETALASLSSHIERADRVLAQSMLAPPEETSASAVADVPHTATFAINTAGKLISVNAAATQAFGVTQGALANDLPFETGEVDRLLAEVARMLKANKASTGVICLRAQATERLIIGQLRLFRPLTEEPFVLVATSDISWPAGFAEQMQSSFGLSLTEVDLLRHLTEGYSVKDIANLRARSQETVRVQVKSLLSKTGTRSQLELVRLAMSSVEALYARSAQALEEAGIVEAETQSLVLKDGRTLTYHILGDPTGRPVLFLPMDFGFVQWPPSAEAEARRRNLKVIVPIRPGYGRSSPMPGDADYLGQLVTDHLDLLDHLRVQKLPVISLGDDSLIAFALAAAAAHRFTALLCCAGNMPLSTAAHYERMGKWHRFVQSAARNTPRLLPFVVKAGAAMARRVGKRRFLETIYASSPADTATFALPEVRSTLATASDVTLSDSFSAHEPFARELVAKTVQDWTRALEILEAAVNRNAMAVRFFNGAQDPQIPPETLDEFQADFPWVNFRVYPDAGQLVFYLKWRDVLAELDRHL